MISKGFYFSSKIAKNKGDRDFKAAITRVSEWSWDEMSGMKLNADGVCVMFFSSRFEEKHFL